MHKLHQAMKYMEDEDINFSLQADRDIIYITPKFTEYTSNSVHLLLLQTFLGFEIHAEGYDEEFGDIVEGLELEDLIYYIYV